MRRPAGDGQMAKRVQPVANLREFFNDALHGALEKQQLAVEDQTEHYVVNLLTLFARSEALYEQTAGRARASSRWWSCCARRSRPPAHAERNRGLQRLGDVSLFVAGFFARELRRASSSTSTTTSPWAGAPTARWRTPCTRRGRVLGQRVRRAVGEIPAHGRCAQRAQRERLHALATRTSCGCTRSG